MKSKCFDIEGDVAGRVSYSFGFNTMSVNIDMEKFNEATKDLVMCGERLGYDYMA